ncbi:MAG: PGF-pre-PGF domain-containing protein [Nanoarchaeota archaeon]|nr:PGF-pre-PGF domain-containing protein [Nanoarchaeota archaeon]
MKLSKKSLEKFLISPKKLFLFVILTILFAVAVNAQTFEFGGYTYNTTKGALNYTNVTIEAYVFGAGGPPTLMASFSNFSNASGYFNITGITLNTNWLYKPVIRHYNGTDADYVGQSLPEFPAQEMQNLGSIDFYLKEGATINITAKNVSGHAISFHYMVKDTKLGYPIQDEFTNYIYNATIYLPADRNYSIMLYPYQSFPIKYNLNNISDYTTNPKHIDVLFNTTEQLLSISGYINCSSAAGFESLDIVAYLIEPGDMIFQGQPLPSNMSAWQSQSDFFNTTSGFYNITLPASAMGIDIMLFATAKNSSDYYGAFRNISLTYGGSDVDGFNFSLQTLLGSVTNISVNNAASASSINVTTEKVSFQLRNSSQNNINYFAFVEAEVDYSSLYTNGPTFSWMEDISSNEAGAFTLPLLNAPIKKMNVFAGQGAPLKTSLTASQLSAATVNVDLPSFNPGAMPGEEAFADLYIDLLRSNAQCDVPYPNVTACSLMPAATEKVKADFNPLSAIMGGGKISFRMRKNSNNITIHYKNVDMLASGPPDALFDSESNSSTAGNSLEEAWRFGSQGPEIYDEVLIGIPYSDDNIDDNAPISLTIKKLFDNSWNTLWDTSINGTTGVGGNLTDYATFNTSWFSGMPCSKTDQTAECYVNTTYNTIWLTIPHFSGVGPTVSSVSQGNVTANASVASIECHENCTVYINVTNSNFTLAQNLQNITINNTKTTSNVINFTISRYNGSEYIYNGTNHTAHLNYNFTYYNGTDSTKIHQYQIEIFKSTNVSTQWNFTYNVSGMSSPLILVIDLTCTENWTCTSWSTCSDNIQTRTCIDHRNCTTTTNRPSLSQSCGTTTTTTTSGGGGSSSQSIEGQFAKKSWGYIPPGDLAELEIDNSEIGFTKVEFTAKTKIYTAVMHVFKLDSLPENIPSYDKQVYKYVHVKEWNLDEEDIENVKIEFKVSKTWLAENGLTSDNIALFRYIDEWKESPTTLQNEDDAYAYYSAATISFSYFAIAATAEPAAVVPEPTIETPEETIETTAPTAAEKAAEIAKSTGSKVFLAILALAIIAALVYFLVMKKDKRKRPKHFGF